MNGYNKKREAGIDGLKGIACIGVMLGHLLGVLIQNNSTPGFAYDLDGNLFLRYALRLVLNGKMYVCIFFAISGYLYSGEEKSNGWIHRKMLKRYLRLSIPIFLCGVVLSILTKCNFIYTTEYMNLTGNMWIFDSVPERIVGVKELLFDAFIGIPLLGESSICGPFWSIKYLLWGILLTIFFDSFLSSTKHKWFTISMFFLSGVIVCTKNTSAAYWLAFLAGSVVRHIDIDWIRKVSSKWVHIIVWGAIVMLIEGIPAKIVCICLRISSMEVLNLMALLCYIPASGLILLEVLSNARFEEVLGRVEGLAKHAYTIYVFHMPIFASFTCWLATVLIKMEVPFGRVIVLDSILSCLMVMMVASAYLKIVDKRVARWIVKINKYFMD